MAKRRVKKETEVNVKVLVDCSKCEYGGEDRKPLNRLFLTMKRNPQRI